MKVSRLWTNHLGRTDFRQFGAVAHSFVTIATTAIAAYVHLILGHVVDWSGLAIFLTGTGAVAHGSHLIGRNQDMQETPVVSETGKEHPPQ